ncbi:hypothetical protein B296_00049046 [Ensete ventricosum]|uniref:Bidirectional sugar transporter SWEET n=1 Tax=Ensete ventricosum TaxID=4639 RepID=A0A426XL23_ENSVE|nr:hypothetical protein B296_00049046 [Ensete ventricosum]
MVPFGHLNLIYLQRLVIKTKSVEYMPFLLSLFVFLCGTSWFVYGLLGGDPFVTVLFSVHILQRWWMVQVPNGCGSALGAMQLILYTIYRNRTATDGGSETNGQGHKPPEDDSRATEKKPDHRPIADQV